MLSACFPWTETPTTAGHVHVQPLPKAHQTYVAIGASDTFGTGTDDPLTESWPADLQAKLGSGIHLVNLGIPGIDAPDALNVELPVALDAHPDLVTVWLAVNDLVDNVPFAQYSQDLNTLFQRLQSANPRVRIVVINVPDLSLLPSFHSVDKQPLETKIAGYNTIIADAVAQHHLLLIDLFHQWSSTLAAHPEYISDDGFHPNAVGYLQLADIVYRALQKTRSS